MNNNCFVIGVDYRTRSVRSVLVDAANGAEFGSSTFYYPHWKDKHELPKLPVGRVLWKPMPNMKDACTARILAGGAHHIGYSQNSTAEHLHDFSLMAGLEYVPIRKATKMHDFRQQLRWNDLYYQLKP